MVNALKFLESHFPQEILNLSETYLKKWTWDKLAEQEYTERAYDSDVIPTAVIKRNFSGDGLDFNDGELLYDKNGILTHGRVRIFWTYGKYRIRLKFLWGKKGVLRGCSLVFDDHTGYHTRDEGPAGFEIRPEWGKVQYWWHREGGFYRDPLEGPAIIYLDINTGSPIEWKFFGDDGFVEMDSLISQYKGDTTKLKNILRWV